jgi:hypothetical protein
MRPPDCRLANSTVLSDAASTPINIAIVDAACGFLKLAQPRHREHCSLNVVPMERCCVPTALTIKRASALCMHSMMGILIREAAGWRSGFSATMSGFS